MNLASFLKLVLQLDQNVIHHLGMDKTNLSR